MPMLVTVVGVGRFWGDCGSVAGLLQRWQYMGCKKARVGHLYCADLAWKFALCATYVVIILGSA